MTRAVKVKARRRRDRPQPARSLHVTGTLARLAACSCCPAAGPNTPCVQRAAGADGLHLARFAEARRRGLITAADFGAVIRAAGAFTNSTVVYDDTFGTAP